MSVKILKKIVAQKGSYYGELICKWDQEEFKIVMEKAEFCSGCQGSYKKKLKLPNGRIATINAYEKGKITIAGCNSEREMKVAINAFLNQKLYKASDTILNFAQNLRISSCRCKIELGLGIDIAGLQSYLTENHRDGKTKPESSKTRVLIPVKFHMFKSVSVYVNKNGVIQILRAHLVENVNEVFKRVFNLLLCDFIITKPQKLPESKMLPTQNRNQYLKNEAISFLNYEQQI